MRFDQFIGQDPIKNELINCAGHHVHILLRGPSGCGKTTLAEMTAALRGNYDMVSARNLSESSLNPEAVTHIVDEAHVLTQPEFIFDIMQTVPFIFCTTETGELTRTLVNRCIGLTLQPYSLQELATIGGQQYDFPPEVLDLIAERSRETPRVMLLTCQRVSINLTDVTNYFTVKNFLGEIGIFEHGYTMDDIRYLSTLTQVGRASAATMASMLELPPATILNEIEPFLLRRRDITITSRGRVLRYDQ